MIEINLVPVYLRKKKKKKSSTVRISSGLPKEAVIGIVVGVVAILLCVHVLLQFFITMKVVQLKKFNSERQESQTSKAKVEKILTTLKEKREKVKNVQAIIGDDDVLWSETLNAVSDSLPRGVWLSRLSFDNSVLVIQGTAVSKNKTEMINVHSFSSNLKRNSTFQDKFHAVDLGLIKSRKINITPVADFTITADLK